MQLSSIPLSRVVPQLPSLMVAITCASRRGESALCLTSIAQGGQRGNDIKPQHHREKWHQIYPSNLSPWQSPRRMCRICGKLSNGRGRNQVSQKHDKWKDGGWRAETEKSLGCYSGRTVGLRRRRVSNVCVKPFIVCEFFVSVFGGLFLLVMIR